MDYFRSKINLYIEKNKKSKKLNNAEIGEVVVLLETVLAEDNSVVDEVINVLGELHYAVTLEFFKKVFTVLDGPVKTDLIKRYLLSDKIVKNSSNFGLTRNLVIVNELLQTTGNDEFTHMILKFCSKKAYGKDAGQKAGELLSKICFSSTKENLFSLDYSTWKETEIQDFSIWLNRAMTVNKDEGVSVAYKAWIEKHNLSKGKEVEVAVNPSVPEAVDNATTRPSLRAETANPNPKNDQREKIHILVSDLQSEVSKIINERLKLTKTIEEIREELEQAIKDKEGLLLQLSEVRTRNDQLQDEIRIKERRIIDGETKYKEIDDRLKNAFKADKSQQNQELTSLKYDLAKRLKLEYQDYKTLASKEPDTQYYEALVGVLESIFDTLRRKGIIINNEIEE